VDDEGFSRQPAGRGSGPGVADPWADFNRPAKNFYSSSDESDDDTKRKIKVEIKPVTAAANGSSGASGAVSSASVDELQRAVGGLELLPTPMVGMILLLFTLTIRMMLISPPII